MRELNGATVKDIRERRGESQERLAVRAGISKATLQYLEQGRRQPHPATLEKLAAALGVSISDITTDTAVA